MKRKNCTLALLIITFFVFLSLPGCSRQEKLTVTEEPQVITAEPADESPQDKPEAAGAPEGQAVTENPAITDIPSVSLPSQEEPVITQPQSDSKDTPAITQPSSDSQDSPAAHPSGASKDTPFLTVSPAVSKDSPSVTVSPAAPKDTPSVTIPPAGSKDGTADSEPTKEDFVSKLNFSADISQLVCVIGSGGADCTVSFHTKNDAGIWSQLFSTDGECGLKGISFNKKEGDGKTPAGLYSFTMAFGLMADPGAKLPYRQITEYDYWLDDVSSPYYNTWVNSKEIPGEYTSEHLIDHAPQYNYALNINYNPDCDPGLGSAIFLHGFNGLGHTTGCIAVSEKYVKKLVRNLDSSARILIVPDSDALKEYQ